MKHVALALLMAAVLVAQTATVTATRPSPAVPSSYFGLTVSNSTMTPVLQYGTSRSWDTWPHPDWSDANPSKGVYNFKPLDAYIAANQRRDMIYTLGRTPRWASSQPNAPTDYGPGQCAPPANIGDWDDYIRATVTHAAGRIKYWEIWNEPQNTKMYCGDIPTMVTLARHARQIIRSLDPSALILSPAPTSAYGPGWLASFLSQGGAATVDIIAFHGYRTKTAEDIGALVTKYKAVMAENEVSNLPMWDTEASGGIMPTMEEDAAFLSKYYLLHWSLGVSRFLWYAYDGAPQWGQLWNPATGPSIAATAYAQTYNWMVGASLIDPCSPDPHAVWICGFSRPGYRAKAIWSSTAPTTITVPPQFIEYRDLLGAVHPIKNGTISVANSPILIETGPLP